MKLGVLVEGGEETRVAIVPNSIPKLTKLGFEVLVESGSGNSAHHSDSEYEAKGANIDFEASLGHIRKQSFWVARAKS